MNHHYHYHCRYYYYSFLFNRRRSQFSSSSSSLVLKNKITTNHHNNKNFTIPKSFSNCYSTTTTKFVSNNINNNNNKMVYVFEPPKVPTVTVIDNNNNDNESLLVFPVHRIYCVGRNYIDHVKEMGGDPKLDPPTFFTKPSDAIVDTNIHKSIPYPLNTTNLHYEVELVVAIGQTVPTTSSSSSNANFSEYIYGYAVGIDLTRRDLQTIAKQSGGPWDCSKAFDRSAPIGPITPKEQWKNQNNENNDIKIQLFIEKNENDNNTNDNNNNNSTTTMILKQSATLSQMIWSVNDILFHLSHNFELQPGDLIFTGTPSGVGPIQKQDIIHGRIDGLHPVQIQIV